MSEEQQRLADRIYRCLYLMGSFRLHSGQLSTEYFDKYQFESDPTLLRDIARLLADLLPSGIDLLGGLELGGVPLATAMSLQTGIPAVFVRKVAKDYGTCKLAEGADIAGRHLCLIEDVVTTGGQILASAQALRSLGAKVANVLCVIQRDPAANDRLQEQGLQLKALFSKAQFQPR